MRDLDGSPRRRARRLATWVSVVVPVVTIVGTVGAVGAYAAPGGKAAAATTATADAHGNGGVGNGVGNGNDKHESATVSSAQSMVTVADAAAATAQPASGTSSASTTATSHVTSGTAGTSGDVTDVQPLSTADQNSGGANGQCKGGPYCSTRDGSPSGNGNQTTGKHTGEPCAGCVGKADNKNPQGQKPNGSDHNAGYECDRNHGIGRTNPAHTGCKSTPPPTCDAPNAMVNGVCTPPPTCDAPNTMVNGVCTPPQGCPEGQTMVNGVCTPPQGCPEGESLVDGTCRPNPDCVPSDANNQCQPTPPVTCPPDAELSPDGTTCVLGEKQTRPPTQGPPTTVEGDKVVKTPSVLPFTGANVDGLLLAGFAGLAAGAGLLVAGRRRRRA